VNAALNSVQADGLASKAELPAVEIHTSGQACIVTARWSDGRERSWAYEPGDELIVTGSMFAEVAMGDLTRAEAMWINDSIIGFIEHTKV
jgi:hypothetical protein